MGKIIIAGIGPGSKEDITPAVLEAVREADAIVGYKYYFQFIEPYVKPGCECIDTGMKRERERAEQAFKLAEQGKTVVVISSGDAGIYGMAPLIYEMKEASLPTPLQGEREVDSSEAISIQVLPGISAFQKAASLLGAPIGHDMCVISLSDLMTPWEVIERRIKAAAVGDFVTAVYNPKSHGRYWQLYRLQELFLQQRSPDTPVGYVRQAGREDQEIKVTTLGEFDPEDVDMFTVILIGNSQSYIVSQRDKEGAKIITPRGYYRMEASPLEGLGRSIMTESFHTIKGELKHQDYPLGHLWALLHAIHTTADFDMERILYTDDHAVETLYEKVKDGSLKTIVTDVTMVTSGIRKGALQRLGVEAKCYLSDPRVIEMTQSPLSSEEDRGRLLTRTQAGIRLAVEEHPDALFAFGNAPTALMELCDLIRKGKAHPAGIIAAPVGFVHVRESKHMVKPFRDIPKIIVEGRKGGSNLAATLCNAILTFDDAEQLKPGRDL